MREILLLCRGIFVLLISRVLGQGAGESIQQINKEQGIANFHRTGLSSILKIEDNIHSIQ